VNAYEARQEERRERYLARSRKAMRERDRRFSAAREIGSRMQGEPIKVGHHSERHHRADIKRMDQHMDAGCREHSKADHYRAKAAGVGRGGISSDDPDALDKLREELSNLESRRESMKATNAAWRKAKRPQANDRDGWAKVAEIMGRDLGELSKVRMDVAQRSGWGQPEPFPRYALTNLGANIRRIKKRIEALESTAGREFERHTVGNLEVERDPDDNRIRIEFPGKPASETRSLLKRWGFRWSPSNTAWQRQWTNAAEYALGQVLAALED